ncbi:MAG: arginase [Gammaproteobacteria bacterium]|nr:arginase [Gammaproteobacteria bacterium]
MHKREIQVIGFASCYGARDQRCDTGPVALKNLQLTTKLENANFDVEWSNSITPHHKPESNQDTLSVILNNCKELARQTYTAVKANKQIIVIGGDHSCAIGTWSGVHSALSSTLPNTLPNTSQLGLIWIDAHMDSHTMETSDSGAIHGMPVASLLGYGDKELCSIESEAPKILPENLCLVGIRSYEPAELKLLNQLGVKVFYMEDIEELGLSKVMQLAQKHVRKNCSRYGVSLDLDAIDPEDAPGVGSPESHGISGSKLVQALKSCNFNDDFIGIEITELNSSRDEVDKTARLAIEAILACLSQQSEKT